MTAEVISIGTELLLGQIVDTDAAYLARRLSALGVAVYHRSTVGDNAERGLEALRLALSRADAVFLIGGLGPTMDDLTRDLISSALDTPLIRDPAIAGRLNALFYRRGIGMPESVLKQADVPDGGVALDNPNGTAPGLWVEKGGKLVAALPGPPNEFEPMVDAQIVPRMEAYLGAARTTIRSRTLRVVGVGESGIEEKLSDLMLGSDPTVAPYAKPAEVHLRITARRASDTEADAAIGPIADEIYRRLGASVYGEGDDALETVVVRALDASGKSVATAESCTGGMLSGRITAVPGSSSVFSTGVVAYANDTKVHLLRVPQALVAEKGAVSPEVGRAMAERVRELSGSDFGLGITGVAGPGGGTPEKPVGLVYVAIADAHGSRVEKCLFLGSRADIRFRATQVALDLVRRVLLEAAAPERSA